MSYPRVSEAVTYPLLPGITDRRLDLFLGGHYTGHNLTAALERGRVTGEEWVRMRVWSAPGTSKPTFEQGAAALRNQADVKPFKKGDSLGPSWTNHWVHVELTIPKEYSTQDEDVIFHFDPNCEGLIYTMSGQVIHAITGGPNSMKDGVPGTAEDRRVEYIIPREAVTAGRYEFIIELSVNAMFGLGLNGFRHQQPDMNMYYPLAIADIVLPRSQARALEIDFKLLTQLARMVGGDTTLARRALHAANEVMNAFKVVDEDEMDEVVQKCRIIAAGVLGDSESKSAIHEDKEGTIWGIGHCHIDTAWLWQYTHSQQKIARSWSTQIDLFKRYPWHQFAASSAQQYAWLEELYPSLYTEVSDAVAASRFHPVGGAWIEHDCVLPSGESLCRQYLYGQRYFEEKFGQGKRCREAWLPDTFGYASQLPQILRLAGLDYFFTQKLSWNNINTFPHTSFNWVGLDGSQVLSHMTPVDTYNAQNDIPEIIKGATTNKNAAINDECLLLFGNGDGGGGPTPRMLEKFKRLASIGEANPAFPQVKMGTPAQFFDRLLERTNNGSSLPTWRGELYFELHRGTYTSQEGLKKGNREMEMLLRDVEYYATIAWLDSKTKGGDYVYPQAQLDAIWKDVLLNQFHDVLPGTSIKLAVDDALEIYVVREREARALLDAALDQLVGKECTSEYDLAILDPIRMRSEEIVAIPASLAGGAKVQHQKLTNGSVLAVSQTSCNGVGRLIESTYTKPSAESDGTRHTLSNAHFTLVIEDGRVTSLIDIALGRELILAGPRAESGGLDIFEDLPLAYDAWDAEIYHLDCAKTIKFDTVKVTESGPLRASLTGVAKFGKSVIEVTFSLDAVSPNAAPDARSFVRVDIVADWHEKHKFLKFSLPLDIHSSTATYGTQFGLIDRPTHRNTTQEQAKFEVCAHGCADLSEVGYGVTLSSAYKYGYAVEGNTMRISLLRSATAPDPTQDEGRHEFAFAIMPHLGRFQESERYKDSLRFTNNVHVRAISRDTTVGALERVTFGVEKDVNGGVVLETVKAGVSPVHAPQSQDSVILRLYESLGGRTRCEVKITGVKAKALSWVNILEEDLDEECEWEQVGDDLRVKASFRAFEIKSLRVVV